MGIIACPWFGFGDLDDDYQILALADEGSTVTATRGETAISFSVDNGVALINGLDDGEWEIQETYGSHFKKETVLISGENERHIIFLFISLVPEFKTHGLSYKIVNNDNDEINEFSGTTGDWKIRFEKNYNGKFGTVVFKELFGQKVDIFIVGGGGSGLFSFAGWGGSGGGGGYTLTAKNIQLEENVEYYVSVGESGEESYFKSSDNASTQISFVAAPGQDAYIEDSKLYGGNGGSGGGGAHCRNDNPDVTPKSGNGGSDGNSGTGGTFGWFYSDTEDMDYLSYSYGGSGQRDIPGPNGETGTTKEFGDENSKYIYSSGGAGGSKVYSQAGSPGYGLREANSGAGGSGNINNAARQRGFSGIVIIRNARG